MNKYIGATLLPLWIVYLFTEYEILLLILSFLIGYSSMVLIIKE